MKQFCGNIHQLKRGKRPISYSAIRNRYQAKHQRSFKCPTTGCEKYVEEFNLFGKKMLVNSSQFASFGSFIQNMSTLEQLNPNCILLDRFSLRNVNFLLNQPIHLKNHLNEAALLGKSKFTKFFVNVMPLQLEYFVIGDCQDAIYRANDDEEMIYLDDQFSAAYHACNDVNKNIILAKPDTLLFFEDIAINYSLAQLQEIFYSVIEELKKITIENNSYPWDSVDQIFYYFREKVRQKYPDLFKKQVLYNASLLMKSARVFSSCMLLVSQSFTRSIVELCKEPVLPEYYQIYRSFLPKEHLLKIPVPENTKINEQIAQKYINIQEERINFEKTLSQKEELLEKLAILSYIYSNELRVEVVNDENPFNVSIFSQILKKDDLQKYLMLHQKYGKELNDLQNHIIKYIASTKGKRQLVLKCKILYNDQIEKLKNKKEKSEYTFSICEIKQAKEQMMLNIIIEKQMEYLIRTRQSQGISQIEMIRAMKEIKEKKFTREGLSNYLKLMADANSLLGSPLKFPQKLQKELLPYIVNIEKQRLAEKITNQIKKQEDTMIRKLKGFDDQFSVISSEYYKGKKEIPSTKKQDDNIFSDEEEDFLSKGVYYDDQGKKIPEKDLKIQKFILGKDEQIDNFPMDINEKSLKELKELGFEDMGEQEFKFDSEGNMETLNSDLDEKMEEELKKMMKKK